MPPSPPPHKWRETNPILSGWAGCLKPAQEINLSEKTTLLTRFQSSGHSGPSHSLFYLADNLLLYQETLAEAPRLYRPEASPNSWAGPPEEAWAPPSWAPSRCCRWAVPGTQRGGYSGARTGSGCPWLQGTGRAQAGPRQGWSGYTSPLGIRPQGPNPGRLGSQGGHGQNSN